MRRIYTFFIGLGAVATLTMAAVPSYADGLPYAYGGPLPYAPLPLSWTGFYVGINGGGGWSANNDQLRDLSNPGFPFRGLSPDGGFGGGQIGYNWQMGHLLLGLETDIQGSDFRDRVHWALATSESDVDWFGTLRGRIGFATDRVLVYATGGWAYGGVRNEEIGVNRYVADNTASGYTVGGGVEFRLTPAWSLKTEYQYINLGMNDPVTATGVRLSSFPGVAVRDDAFNTFRVGLNYRFGADYPPPPPPLK
jgi:outer membrane immunogenic protein